MPLVAMICGGLLEVLGIAGFLMTGAPTSLIPAVLGGLLFACGFLARSRPDWQRHAMHAAAGLGLLGFLGSASALLKLPTLLAGGFVERPAAVTSRVAMAVVCFIFVALCVKSFIDARRAKA
jgi:hypothetical protein